MSEGDLKPNLLHESAVQYFGTMANHFKGQAGDTEVQKKKTEKGIASRRNGCKKTKHRQRLAAVDKFEDTHQVTGVKEYITEKGWMSSEDEGAGNVPKEEWEAKANAI